MRQKRFILFDKYAKILNVRAKIWICLSKCGFPQIYKKDKK